MARIFDRRMTAELDGEFVVFLIGMRVNAWWKVHKWWPVFTAMPAMLKELYANPASGFLGHVFTMKMIVQYWRSYDQLEAYARSRDGKHWPAWVEFNKRMKESRGDVGIWHETYVIKPGNYESIYSGMPAFGLGKAGRLVPAEGSREGSRQRLGVSLQ